MLAWLKEILGELYTDEIDNSVSKKIGENFVSKADFNEKNEAVKRLEKDVKDRDAQLDTLKKSEGSTQDLKNQIANLQQQNKEAKEQYEAELANIKLDIKTLRALTGMSQNEFAKYFEMPAGTLRNWEQGIRACPEYLIKLMVSKLKNDKMI